MRKARISSPVVVSALLLALCLISCGQLIFQPGFFGDDLTMLWLHQRSGLSGLQAFFGDGQPLSALLISALLDLGGQTAWFYQLLAVLVRWLGALAFWLLLREVRPQDGNKTLLAALIFLVFPGFKHLPAALSALLHLLALALTCAGFALTIKGIRTPRRRRVYFTAAWISGLSLLLSQYFLAFEALRLFLIWKTWQREGGAGRRETFKKSALTWLPFGAFLLARLLTGWPPVMTINREAPAEILRAAVTDLLDAVVLAWRQIFSIPHAAGDILVYLLAVLAAGLMTAWMMRRKADAPASQPVRAWRDEFLLAGVGALFLGGLPLWLTGESTGLDYPASLSMLAFLPGAALLITALIDLLLLPRFQTALAAILIALAAGAQLQNGAAFIRDWQRVERMAQQLHARIPTVKEGTLFVSEQAPLDYFSEENLSALLNLVYFPRQKGEIDGALFLNADSAAQAADEDGEIEKNGRGFHFNGSISQAAAFYQPENGCLRLLKAGEVNTADLPHSLGMLLARLQMEEPAPMADQTSVLPAFLTPEMGSERCLTLQKIALANQRGEWERSRQWLDAAGSRLLDVQNPLELIPLIEAAAHNQQLDVLLELSDQAAAPAGGPFELCRAYERISRAEDVSQAVKQTVETLRRLAFCENYD